MTQRKHTTIKQGVLTDVMSHLSELPKRPKDPGKPVSLAEMFEDKKYAVKIEKALEKGYTLDDLAAIFSEQSGIEVTARQMKYHYTRAKNKRANEQKSADANTPIPAGSTVMPADSPRKYSTDVVEETPDDTTQRDINSPPQEASQPLAFGSDIEQECPSANGVFPIEQIWRNS